MHTVYFTGPQACCQSHIIVHRRFEQKYRSLVILFHHNETFGFLGENVIAVFQGQHIWRYICAVVKGFQSQNRVQLGKIFKFQVSLILVLVKVENKIKSVVESISTNSNVNFKLVIKLLYDNYSKMIWITRENQRKNTNWITYLKFIVS